MQQFDCLVFIGRFQPFHLGHAFVIAQAFEQTDHVIVLVGSSNLPRTLKNPFSFDERKRMIEQSINLKSHQRLDCLPLPDTFYNDNLWLQYAQQAVASVSDTPNIGLIGHSKDDSSYYLKLFPMWGYYEVPSYDNLSATPIRQAYFEGRILSEFLPPASIQWLEQFYHGDDYRYLLSQYEHIKDYQAKFSSLPYPPIFQTTDALVVQAGHILVIRRGGVYGQGLLALAGGFLDANESLQACVVRELKEETGLDVACLTPKSVRCFDKPSRSERGRTITTVFLYELTGDSLPVLTAGDDASQAFWLPLSKLNAQEFFEDHYGIICAMLGIS